MHRSLGRPAALVGALALVVGGFVPTAVSVAVDGWLPGGGYLLFQAMLTVAGLLLWWSRESHRHAALLLLAGVLVGVSNVDAFYRGGTTYLIQIGWTLQWCAVPLVATVLLEYPEDRSRRRSRRLLVQGFWAWALGVRVIASLLWSPADDGYTGPARWFTLYPANPVVRVVEAAGTGLLAALVVWFVVVEIRRWRDARGAGRAATRLVALAGTVLAVGLLLRVSWGYAVEAGWVGERAEPWIAGTHAASGALAAAALVVVAVRAATRRAAVVERLLAAGGDGGAVQQVLAQALADPTLRLRFAVGPGWVGVDGRPAGPAAGDGRTTQVLLREDERPVVELDAEEHVLLDPATLRVTLAAASLVLHNARLTVERAAHLAEVQASRARIVEAGVAQRRRLERDLHDGAQQSLLAVSATLSRASMATAPDDMRVVVEEARTGLTAALAEVRRLARGIHPAALSQGGLVAGLEALAAGSRSVELTVDPELVQGRRYSTAVESTAYYVVAEALTNAVKHAGPGPVRVAVHAEPDAVVVSVADDGPGGAHAEPGGGLAGLSDRVGALGGVLSVESPAGRGTTVRARLPERPGL